MFAIAAEVAALVGAAARHPHRDRRGAASPYGATGAMRWPRGRAIADALHGSFPVIYGCDLTLPVAYRWKTQINENAKHPAFTHALPEMDHNEIVGWDPARRLGPVLGGLPRGPRPASARAPARRADGEADRARGTGGPEDRGRGRDPHRPHALGRDAGRPRLAASGGGTRGRSLADRHDRPAEGRAGPVGVDAR